jgi:lipopolysaccharide transport system ATP-binding protein
MKPIIKVEGLSKQYIIGARQARYATLREAILEKARAPLKRFRSNGRAKPEALWALRDVSFEVPPGEAVGIIGRNGAGKTTLLKVLSRITDPTTGRFALYGRVGSLLEVGTGFHPELSGRENIFLNGAILGMRRMEIARKFDEIVAFAEVDRFIDTPVKHYSTGMHMRLAFAVAAHLEPEILLVDEVLAVGDVSFQKKCLGKMDDVARHGRTVLFVSHNMEAVRRLCSRALLLEEGRLAAIGETGALIKKYLENAAAQASYQIVPPAPDEDVPGYAYRLVVENENGKPAASLPVGRPWQVRVYFRVTRRMEHFIAALGLRTAEGVPIRTGWSAPQTIEPGDYQAVFRETNLVLSAGIYHLVVGLSTYERTFHYADCAGALEIAEYSEGVNLVRLSRSGLILNPFQIEIKRSRR